MERKAPDHETPIVSSAMIDTAIRVGLVALLVYACVRIILPFAFLLLWSAILAVMLHPLQSRFAARFGNRSSAILIGLIGVAALLAPMVIAVTSLATSLYSLLSGLQARDLALPQPPLWLDGTPLVGKKLTEIWVLVASNLPAALTKYGHLLSTPVTWLALFAGSLAIGEVSFVISFAIAVILVAYGSESAGFARRVLERLTGSSSRASELLALIAATIRGVGLGVVGVALAQSLLLGLGFFAIGLRVAGPLTLIALILGIMQVPLVMLTLPVVMYVFVHETIQTSIIFLIWSIIAGLSDNALRPLLFGRGLDVPMPVILIGVIGGMVVDGLLGLFVGPVLLAVSYVLLLDWLQQKSF